METINYNGRDLYIGSIAESHETIKEHMLAHFNLNETETDDWFLQFNSQVKEMNNFLELSKDKKVLFDIGSQFGSFSFPFIGNNENKQAYAFDGGTNPFLTTTQIKMINNLNNFYPFNFLIGNKNEMIDCFSESLQSLALAGPDRRMMFSIDMISNMYNIEPDVMKIDIEGCEYQALLGAREMIMNSRPMIFIEVHPRFLLQYQNSINDIVDFVKSINYKVFDLNNNEVTDYLDILSREETDSNRTVWIPNN